MAFGRKKSQEPQGRRRRTVVKSVAESTPTSNIYSYNSRRSETPEPRRRPTVSSKESSSFSVKRFFAKGSSGLVLIGLIIVGIYLLSLSTNPVIRVIDEGQNAFLVRDPQTYISSTQDILKSSFWNRSKLTVDVKDLEKNLETGYPELESVNVVVPFFGNRPVVYIEPAKPALILAASNGEYVLNNKGKVMIMQANLPKGLKLSNIPVVNDQSNLKATLNEQALTSNDIEFIKAILAQLNAKQVKYSALTLPAGASELDVQIAGQPYFVKFNMQEVKRAREQAGTFLATQQELARKKIVPSQYIDVRVEGRAYYK